MSIHELSETTATLEAMAMTAANTYYDTAVKYGLSRYPKLGVKRSRNWPRFMQIARICMNGNIPVESFVTAAFLRTMERHPVVSVNDICSFDPSNMSSDGSVSEAHTSPQDLWNMLSCKLLDMVFSIDGVSDKLTLLDNPMYGFPAWFRVFSPETPPPDILVHWGDLAIDDLNRDLKLKNYIEAKRPKTLELLKLIIEKAK